MFCLILAVLASQMRASSYYIMIGYIPRCTHIITNSTDVGRFAKAFGSIYLYKVLRCSAYIPHDLDLECAYMREYTSVYRDHRVSIGLCKWRRCIHLCLTQTQKVMLMYI